MNGPPTKYKSPKVRISRDRSMDSPAPSKYNFLNQHPSIGPPLKYKFLKVQISREHHMDTTPSAQYKFLKVRNPPEDWATTLYEHTPYGPYNLPHMVLRTKKDLIMPSTTKEIIEVTQLNMQKARHAQIEMLNKLNKCNNPFLLLTQEPYCYKSTLALLPQNAKTIPSDRTGHPRTSITASNRLQMAEISELKLVDKMRDLFQP